MADDRDVPSAGVFRDWHCSPRGLSSRVIYEASPEGTMIRIVIDQSVSVVSAKWLSSRMVLLARLSSVASQMRTLSEYCKKTAMKTKKMKL